MEEEVFDAPRRRPHHFTVPLSLDEVITEVVPDLVHRIVEAVHPIRIILFGSVARGEVGPESDIDVLVILPDKTDQNHALNSIYRGMRGLGFAVDALVISESDLVCVADDPWMVYRNVLAEGKEIYRVESAR